MLDRPKGEWGRWPGGAYRKVLAQAVAGRAGGARTSVASATMPISVFGQLVTGFIGAGGPAKLGFGR